ncbi:hypothetical protein V5799_025592 [Amblyomma americanum]|uniref:Uncharacterized protein n=1 Tax=Amblyomma americanum TaxID=6943 RepID=A0AAQ4E905_AMBAM
MRPASVRTRRRKGEILSPVRDPIAAALVLDVHGRLISMREAILCDLVAPKALKSVINYEGVVLTKPEAQFSRHLVTSCGYVSLYPRLIASFRLLKDGIASAFGNARVLPERLFPSLRSRLR